MTHFYYCLFSSLPTDTNIGTIVFQRETAPTSAVSGNQSENTIGAAGIHLFLIIMAETLFANIPDTKEGKKLLKKYRAAFFQYNS